MLLYLLFDLIDTFLKFDFVALSLKAKEGQKSVSMVRGSQKEPGCRSLAANPQ